MSEMVLNIIGRQDDSRAGANRHAAGGTGTERSGRVRVSEDRPERNTDEAAAEAAGEFPHLLDSLIERHNPSLQTDHFARQVLQANQRALANQRITEDDLRVMDDATRGEGSGPDHGNSTGRTGAVAIERAEMGKGAMAFLYRPNSAEVARALQANAERASGAGADPLKNESASAGKGDHGDRPASSRSSSGSTPEAPAGGRPLADVVHATTSGKVPATPASTPALSAAAVQRAAAPVPVQKAGGTKSSLAAARLTKTVPAPASVQARPRQTSQQGSDTGAGEHGLDSRGQGKPIEMTAIKAKAESSDGLSPAARRKTVENVERVLLSNLKEGQSTVRLQLSPPHLGKLLIEMNMENSRLAIRFEAENPQVRALLQDSAARLSNLLGEQGVSLDRLEVVLSETASDGPGFEQELDAHSEPSESSGDSVSDRSPEADGEGATIGEAEQALPGSAQERSMSAGKLDVRA